MHMNDWFDQQPDGRLKGPSAFEPRAEPPNELVPLNAELCWVIWANKPIYTEDTKPWKVIAAFRFLNDCLDYIAHCQDVGVDVIYQNPTYCRLIRHEHERVVYRPEPFHV